MRQGFGKPEVVQRMKDSWCAMKRESTNTGCQYFAGTESRATIASQFRRGSERKGRMENYFVMTILIFLGLVGAVAFGSAFESCQQTEKYKACITAVKDPVKCK